MLATYSHNNHTAHTHMHSLHHVAATLMLEAGPPCAWVLFSPYIFTLDPALSTSLLHSVPFLLLLRHICFPEKCAKHAALGDGGGFKPRPRFPSLALLNRTQQLQHSPASWQLSKISRKDPQPLQGEAGTNWHVWSFMESSGPSCFLSRKVRFLASDVCKLFPARTEPLCAWRDHACAQIKQVYVGVFYEKQMPAAFQILFACNQINWSWHADVNTELLSLRKVVFTICGARSEHCYYNCANPSLLG